MIHLIPTNRQTPKLSKHVLRTIKLWSSEDVEELCTCLKSIDLDTIRDTSDNFDEFKDTVTSYLHFCLSITVTLRARLSYNSDTTWFSPKLKQLWLEKREVLRSRDRDYYEEAKYRQRGGHR